MTTELDIDELGEFLEHQGFGDDEIDEYFLAHYGVKGQKWGVRRANSRDARSVRLKNGTATKRDKLIREADIDGGRTHAIKIGEIKQTSSEKAGKVIVGALLVAYGTLTLATIKM